MRVVCIAIMSLFASSAVQAQSASDHPLQLKPFVDQRNEALDKAAMCQSDAIVDAQRLAGIKDQFAKALTRIQELEDKYEPKSK